MLTSLLLVIHQWALLQWFGDWWNGLSHKFIPYRRDLGSAVQHADCCGRGRIKYVFPYMSCFNWTASLIVDDGWPPSQYQAFVITPWWKLHILSMADFRCLVALYNSLQIGNNVYHRHIMLPRILKCQSGPCDGQYGICYDSFPNKGVVSTACLYRKLDNTLVYNLHFF